MKRVLIVLLILIMLLSACSPAEFITGADPRNQNGGFYNSFDLPSDAGLFDANTGFVPGTAHVYFDEAGNAYPWGTKDNSETMPASSEQIDTTTAAEETTGTEEATSPEETTEEETVPLTLPEETTEEPTETETEETTEIPSETLPSEEETTEDLPPETLPPTTEPPVPETTKQPETQAPEPANPIMENGKTWSWVDVNLSTQTVTIYNGDQAIGSFPCVTGCIDEGWGTPTGTYSIKSKERNRMLGGTSFVKYWMPFYKDYGLHDASWRNGNFRSDHAWYYGSHGCVNMPEEGAKFIWDHCSKGDTVIVRGAVKNPGKHTGHDLSGPWVVEKEPTCTEPGQKVQYCPYCYAVASNPRKIPATGHQWGEWETVAGKRVRVCSVCGIQETEGEHLHEWNAWTSIGAETHSRSCKNCGDTQTEKHKFESVITPATETEKGYTTHTCSECGYSYKDNYTDVHVHNFGKWVYYEDNTHRRICSCGEKEIEECSFDAGVVTPPTETEQGYTTYTCTVCGYSYQDNFVDALGHTHVFGAWKSNKDGTHSRTCTTCSEGIETEQCSWSVASEKNVTEEDDNYIYNYKVTKYNPCICGQTKADEKVLVSKTAKEKPTEPHEHSWAIASETEVTEEDENYIYVYKLIKYQACSCGETKADEKILISKTEKPTEPPHEHSWSVASENEVTEEDDNYIYVYKVIKYNNCSCGEAKADEKILISKTEKETAAETQSAPEETLPDPSETSTENP